MVRNYKDLDIFHLAYDFVIKLYPLIDKFPETENKNLILQIKRAAVSLPMNIAEGNSRSTDRAFLSFLNYVFGSAKELEVSLKLSKDLGFLDKTNYLELVEELDSFVCKLANLMRYLEKEVGLKKEVAMARISRGERVW
jgi:four helix bundle protein